MEHSVVVRVVEMREYAEKLAVDVFRGGGEGWSEICANFSGEVLGVIQSLLNPGHNVIYVRGCREFYLFPILIDPSVVKSGASRHGRT